MPDAKTLKALYAIVNEAEHLLAQVGGDLMFQIKPEGGLEVVRRARDGRAAEPEAVVADITGADPLLWQAARPEGAVTLGQPYRDPEPRCALSGRPLSRSAPAGLYYQGRPVDVDSALAMAPRLVFLHELMRWLSVLVAELWQRMPLPDADGEAGETAETQAAMAAARSTWDRFLVRLSEALQRAPEWPPGTKPSDVPEEN